MNHYQQLEAEAIEIIREAVAGARKPVMMYSIGKDSSVMLHLARKAFYPAPPPFPLLHIDTTWKFQAMYTHRARMVEESGMELLTHTNPEGLKQNVNPFTHGSNYHTDVMKTQALRQALDMHGFDVVFGGARRGPRNAFSRSARLGTGGILSRSDLSCGIFTTRALARTNRFVCFPFPTGPNSISGSTCMWKRSPSCRCTLRPSDPW